MDRRLQLQIVFAFMPIYAALLFAVRPEPTPAQVVFRAAMALLGVVGFVAVSRRPRSR